MSAALDFAPADIETLVVGWLMPLHRTAISRRAGDPYPFLLVQQLASTEDLEESTADSVVQIDIMCEQSLGDDAARDVKNRVHVRMLQLGRHLEVDGTIDWMRVFESPRRMQHHNEQIIRYVARYQFGQTYETEWVKTPVVPPTIPGWSFGDGAPPAGGPGEAYLDFQTGDVYADGSTAPWSFGQGPPKGSAPAGHVYYDTASGKIYRRSGAGSTAPWHIAKGAPGSVPDSNVGDVYLDTDSGTIYRLD